MHLALTAKASLIGGTIFGSLGLLQFFSPTDINGSKQDRYLRWPQAVVTTSKTIPNTNALTDSNSAESLTSGTNRSTETCRQNMAKKVEMLRRGLGFLNTIQDYTAIIDKQEVVRDELLDQQSILIKCRRHPLSVYLQWTIGDVGREAIYVDGANEGKMIAHDGGWKAKIPAFHIAPDCKLAMRDARYPITNAGLLFLIEEMLEVHESDLKSSNFEICEFSDDVQFDGRPCRQFVTEYKSRVTSPIYRKSITVIDQEWNVPLMTEHFGWPNSEASTITSAVDDATILERYAFRDLSFNQHLSDVDFDYQNKGYNFR